MANVITDTAYIVRYVNWNGFTENDYYFNREEAESIYNYEVEGDEEVFASKHLIQEEHLARGYAEIELKAHYYKRG